ncbi:MAG: cysteine hydrolase [Planctomycetes bacterium]|nr:cysteine hydrolase [Planctomycetota bacterium]MCA8935705.1 cysteine hydrolase [Planctomycetota bacterium]MCA8947799.1 cysteine hydrolase [Planctomycetota bacterium]
MQRPLIVVDVQRGNISEYNRFIPNGIASIIKAELFNPIIFTRYVNTPDSPARLFLENEDMSDFSSAGIETKISEVMGAKAPGLDTYGVTPLPEGYGAKRYLLTKNTYSVVTPEFEELLAELDLDNSGMYVVGADTESSVLKTALDLFERTIEPIILAEFCGSHRGLGNHERALELMKELIGAERVISDYMPLRHRWERSKNG